MMLSYGFSCRVHAPKHDLGGTLDVVFTQTDLPVQVSTSHTGLSDHCLLTWKAPVPQPNRSYATISVRSWHRLDLSELRQAVSNSLLCQPDAWPSDVNDLSSLYDSTLTAILDTLIPSHTVTLRRRPSDPWFDEECRLAKKFVRRF